jgi:UPF0755 protein
MMNKRKSLFGGCLLLSLVGVCLTAAIFTSALVGIQNRAYQLFGKPSDGLTAQQRLYLSLQLLIHEQTLTYPGDPLGEPTTFEIQLGESTLSVIERLELLGLVSNADALRAYLVYRGLDTTLQAGIYELSPQLTPVEIALKLQDATPTVVNFRVLPGWRLEEIAQALPTSGLNITADEFLIAARSRINGYSYSEGLPSHATMEGFIYPDAYQFRRDVPIQEFINTFLRKFGEQMTLDMLNGFERQGLDIYQAVTLASIVEKESVVNEEMPLIASVFLNRLAAGMSLESDPTVQYAIGYNPEQNTWWTNPLSVQDLSYSSPYNTYQVPGLPPGPIANPGIDALQAVAFPAQTPYYYFRATCDSSGRHVFAETFQQHVSNACP